VIRVRRWRGPDEALRVTASGLRCPRPGDGITSARIELRGGIFHAMVPFGEDGVWYCVARGEYEVRVSEMAAEWLRTKVIGCWGHGGVAVRDSYDEDAFEAAMLARANAGTGVRAAA
jgi:hypothetical protein